MQHKSIAGLSITIALLGISLFSNAPSWAAADTTPPTGTIKINNNAAYTNTMAVILNLTAVDKGSGVSQMRFSNDNKTWPTSEAYAATKTWTLTSGSGVKTVYVKYKDKTGNWSGAYSDMIVLDMSAPTGAIRISNGAATTTTATVMLNLSATDSGSGMGSGAQMKFSNNNIIWSAAQAYDATRLWTITSASGIKFVYVKYKDTAGNWSRAYSDTIVLDMSAPTGAISINNGASATAVTAVMLNLSAADSGSGMGSGAQMKFSNNNKTWSSPEAYAKAKSWTLTSGSGTKIVYVKYKDAAGNWSSVYSDTILLSAPTKLDITYPLEYRAVNTQSVLVSGIISGNPNVIITVNGGTAAITGSTFSALINLNAGSNTITIQAHSGGNIVYEDSIQIVYKPSSIYEDNAYAHIYGEMDKYYKKALDFKVELQTAAKSARVKVSDYHTIGTNMAEARIPLSAFESSGINLSALKAVAFIFSECPGGTVYFDDIKFININTGDEVRIDDFENALPNNNLLSFWTADGGSCALSSDIAGEHEIIWNDPYDYWYTVLGTSFNGAAWTHLSFRIRMPGWTTPRLIESYVNTANFNDGHSAKIYDNALAVTALLARGAPEDIERAKILCNAFLYCQQNDPVFSDGRIRDEYWPTSIKGVSNNYASVKEPGSGCGNLAWVITALEQTYEFDKSNTQFLAAALKLSNFIQNEYYDSSPGYMMGYIGWEPNQFKIIAKSTENNAALYAAFYKLYQLTGDVNWRNRAESIYDYLQVKAWNGVDKFFWRGGSGNFNPDRVSPALDANALSLLAIGKLNMYKEALAWVERNSRLTADGFTGFDFNTDKDGVWFEGTAQMALAYKVYDRDTDSDEYLSQLRRAQSSAINSNGKGIVAASHDGVTTGFENKNYYAALHIGATAWFLGAERGTNLLWGQSAMDNVPSVQSKISGKVTLESRTNHANKVTFYLTNPGGITPLASYLPPNDEDMLRPGIQVTTDSNGNYELINLPAGVFDLYAKPEGFLRVKRQNISIQKDTCIENIDFTGALSGDCNDDNIVNSKDIAIINSSLGSAAGDSNWDNRADINGDGRVHSLDLAIANNNIGRTGALGRDITGAIINITQPEQGAIALGSPITVDVRGTVDQDDTAVSVNGSPAAVSSGIFARAVTLTNPANIITAEAIDSESHGTSDSITIAYSDKKPVLILDDFEDEIRGICDFRWWGNSDGFATYLTRYKDGQISKDGRFSMKTVYQKWPGHEYSCFDVYPPEGSSSINLADYSQLRFWICTKDPSLTIRVTLFDTNVATLTLPDFVSAHPGQWQEVVYDFSGTNMIDFEHVNTIRFIVDPGNDHAKGEFNIDGIKLIAKNKQYLPITPAAPVLSGPQPGHIYDSFKISWTDTSSSGGRLYELWESKDINFTNPIKYFRSASSLTLEGMVSAGTYYYKVRAWTNLPEEGGISSPWSGAYEVITADEPPEIEKVDSWTSSGDNDNRYERGLLININVVEKYKAKDITAGTVRITSASAGYDSGTRQLSPVADGAYWTDAWDTTGLAAACDYIVNTTLTDSSGKTDSDGSPETPDLTITLLEATAPLLSKLVENTDLSYPGRGMSVKITRIYDHSLQDIEPLGLGWTHSYVIRLKEYPDGRVDFVMGNGKETSFIPLGSGAYTNKPGVYDKLIKNSDGTYKITKKDKTALNFDASGKLLSIADTNGNTISLSYDADGRLQTITDPSNGVYTFAYKTWSVMNIGAHTRLASITDPAGRVMKYYYDDHGMLTSTEDMMNNITSYSYAPVSVNGQSLSRLSGIQYPEGGRKYFTYYGGDYGRLASEYKDNGEDKRTYIYSAVEPKLTIRDYYNKDTVIYFNESGRTTSVTDAYLKTTRYTWDSNLNRTSITDPKGKQTTFTYDDTGNMLSATRTKNGTAYTTTYVYDRRESRRDDLTYNKLKTITDTKGRLTTEFDYDPANGNLLSITNKIPDKQDYVTSFAYDAYGRLNTKTDAKNHITKYTYYNNGLLKEENKQESTAVMNTTAYTYDTYGNPQSVTDSENNTTTYTYSALDQLLDVEDANLHSTAYTYDTNGNLKAITDAKNHTTTYNYDPLNRLTSLTHEDGSNISYVYNKMSNLVTKQDQSAKTTAYTYDNVYRLTKKQYHDTTAVNYAYYDDGALKDVTDSNGAIHYDYNEWNELTQVTYPGNVIVSYTYDELGNRTSMTYPSGKVVHYTYDIMNRLKAVTLEGATPKAAAYTWNALSQREQLELPNGSKADYTYDALNRLESLTNKTSTDSVIAAFTYTHDKVGNRKTMTDNDGLHQYNYDNTYQLTGVDYPAKPDQDYFYDSAGNRETVVEDGAPAAYTTDNMNRYTAVNTTIYGYDNNGCLTSKTDASGTTTYRYDFENRLIKASSLRGSEATEAIYTYDYLGRRTQKTLQAPSSKLQVHYVYDNNRVIAEYDSTGLICEYVYGNSIDEILYMIKGANVYYYHYDGLGSVRAITDSSESVIETYTYDIYGKPTIYDAAGEEIAESKFGNRFYFTGREYDKETGLYYYRHRYYDPTLGRFMSPDPMGPVDGPNLYTYVGNNPGNLTDALGLLWGKGLADYVWEILKAIVDAVNRVPVIQLSETADELDKTLEKVKERNKDDYEQWQEWIDQGLAPGPNPIPKP